MQVWSENELEFLRAHLRLNTKEIYDAFLEEFGSGHRTYDSIQKKIKKLRDAFEPNDGVTDNEAEEQLAEMLACHKDSGITKPVDAALKIANKESRIQFIKDLIEESPNFKLPKVLPPVESEKSSLVMVFSDTHCGQQNKGFGIKEFNDRLEEYPELVYKKVKGQDIDEVVITMIGDMLEGEDVYATQPWHLNCPTIEQLEIATSRFWRLILKVRELFKCPVRIICVPGNHGAGSKYTNEKTNWDNVLYHCLKILLGESSIEDVSIEHDGSPFRVFNVKDRVGLLYHYGTKHTGTPAMREKIAGWVTSKDCDFLICGHFHEWKVGSWHDASIISNGSLCGPNDLSEKMAQNTPARQGYFLVTPGEPLGPFGFTEWKVIDEISSHKKKLK